MAPTELLEFWQTNRQNREELSKSWQEFVEAFERANRWNHIYDEQDEREYQTGRAPRASSYTEYRGILRLLQSYRKALIDIGRTDAHQVFALWLQELNIMFERDDSRQIVTPRKHSQQWHQEKRQDMRENFLYQEYIEQLDDADSIRTYAFFSTFVAIKGVIALLTNHKDAAAALRSVHTGGGVLPSREDALRFSQREDYDPHDPTWYVGNALLDVPGIWEAAQTLQLHYAELVRAERSVDDALEITELPDDPFDGSFSFRFEPPEELRVENAIQAFTAGEGSSDMVASRYGVPQKRFRVILRERGLMPSPGGSRKVQ